MISALAMKENEGKIKKYKHEITGKFKKFKPPIFDGEVKNGEEDEAWLPGMKKYFTVYNYSNSMKAKMAIFKLVEKS